MSEPKEIIRDYHSITDPEMTQFSRINGLPLA